MKTAIVFLFQTFMKYSTALQNYRYMALHNIALQYVTNTSLITLNCTINFNPKVTIPKKKKQKIPWEYTTLDEKAVILGRV